MKKLFRLLNFILNLENRLSNLEHREKINDGCFAWLSDRLAEYEKKEAEEMIKNQSIANFHAQLLTNYSNN